MWFLDNCGFKLDSKDVSDTTDVYGNVVLPMDNDDVKSTVEMDPMIMAYGAQWQRKSQPQLYQQQTERACKNYSKHQKDHW